MYVMVNYFFFFVFIIFFSFVLYFLNLFVGMIKYKGKEKCLPFECGFDPFYKNFMPVSIPFYLVCLMFLVFDVEVVMLIPFVYFMFYLDSIFIMSVFLLFVLIMLLTLLYEWNSSYLDWLF